MEHKSSWVGGWSRGIIRKKEMWIVVVLILKPFQFQSHLWNFMSCTDEMFYGGIMSDVVSVGGLRVERMKMTLWLRAQRRKINSFEAFISLSLRLSGYIEYSRMASCDAFKFQLPRFSIHGAIFLHLKSVLRRHPQAAHKMHILKIKRKFVSYLLCSMGISFCNASRRLLLLLLLARLLHGNIIKKENLFHSGGAEKSRQPNDEQKK